MSEARIEDVQNRRGRKMSRSRRNAMKDALPDIQPPLPIKEDVEAESDEDDD